jgi:hypothetical protein
VTYNKLQYNSILLVTAVVKSTITHMLVKPELRQSEFGIKAGRPRWTWYFIHPTNAGTVLVLKTSSTMLEALWMF